MIDNIVILNHNADYQNEIDDLVSLFENASIETKINPNKLFNIKNSLILMYSYHSGCNIIGDKSNKIAFVVRNNNIVPQDILAIIKSNYVIVDGIRSAYIIHNQLKYKDINKKIVIIPPWCKSNNIYDNNDISNVYLDSTDIQLNFVLKDYKISPKFKSAIHIYLKPTTKLYYVIQSMANGAIVIAKNISPFNDIILNYHNGFLIDNLNDIPDIFSTINDRRYNIIYNSKSSISQIINSTKLINNYMNLDKVNSVEFPAVNVKRDDRKWVVRERILINGKISYFPETIRPNLLSVNLNNLHEILSYFSMQDFSDVYIFGCHIPNEISKSEELELMQLINKIGSKSYKLHFCTNKPIPNRLNKIFSKLSIISIEEGLKQIDN